LPLKWKISPSRLTAERLYLSYEAVLAGAFGTIIPLFAIYFRFADLTLFQIALLAFVFEGTILLLEVPTGAIADLSGRVSVMRLAAGLLFLSGITFVLSRSLSWFIVAEILCGIGESLRSGTADAWISVRLQQEGRGRQLSRLLSRKVKYKFAAGFCGMLVGGLIAGWWLAGGWMVFTMLAAVAGAAALLMNDKDSETAAGARPRPAAFFAHAAAGLKRIVDTRRLVAILVLLLTANAAYEGVDQFWQVYLKEQHNTPAILFGMATAAAALILFLIAERAVPWLEKRIGFHSGIWALSTVVLVMLAVFTLSSSVPLLIGALVVFTVARSLQEPLVVSFISENSPAQSRATILSASNLVSSDGEMIAALLLGWLAGAVGLKPVFLIGLLLIALGLVGFSAIFRSRD
jgi:MFS family permease